MKGKLIKLSNNKNELRTSEVDGTFESYPRVGNYFTILGEPIDKKYDARLVTTSMINYVKKKDNKYTFNTLNSTYRLEILENEDAIT